ncbi:MAG: DUF4199 domain-containing protein [Bacteroidaceae bacterium]
MTNESQKIPDSPRQRTEYAGHCALSVAGMWIAAFACLVYTIHYPLLEIVSDTLFLLSVYMIYMMVVRYRTLVAPLGFVGSFRMAWRICMFATLLTILAQYLYLRFLDGGRLIENMTKVMSSEQYIQVTREIMPQMNIEQMKTMMQSITLGDMTLCLWILYMLISLPVSLLTGIIASMKKE